MMGEEKKIVWEGKYLRMAMRGSWEFVERTISRVVGIVPVTDDAKVVLVEQYRPPLDKNVIALPAGIAGDIPGQEDEDIETAARRELLEETGYEASVWKRLFQGVVSGGLTDESVVFYHASGLKKVGAGGGDASESITVHEVAVDDLVDWLAEREKDGIAIDLKVYAVLHFCR
jgi:ADP-ribose pyrophosphatase